MLKLFKNIHNKQIHLPIAFIHIIDNVVGQQDLNGNSQVDLTEIYNEPTYDELKEALENYLNPSDTIYSGEVYANLHLVDPEELDHIAYIFSLSNNEIVLPPGEETTLEATFMYPNGFGMDLDTDSIFVFQLFSHAHELMIRFDVEFVGGELDGELLYTALDWEHPPTFELDPPLIITIGQGFRLRTTYYNWSFIFF